MSSRRRIASSRANGAKSRGPVTPEGRERCAQSALTHGLAAANTVVLSNESRDAFHTLFAAYAGHYQPQSPIELDAVEDLAVSRWRQRRLIGIEAATIDLEMAEQAAELREEFTTLDEDGRQARAIRALNEKSTVLSNLNRYEYRHRRTYEKARQFLEKTSAPAAAEGPSPISEHHPIAA